MSEADIVLDVPSNSGRSFWSRIGGILWGLKSSPGKLSRSSSRESLERSFLAACFLDLLSLARKPMESKLELRPRQQIVNTGCRKDSHTDIRSINGVDMKKSIHRGSFFCVTLQKRYAMILSTKVAATVIVNNGTRRSKKVKIKLFRVFKNLKVFTKLERHPSYFKKKKVQVGVTY